MLLGTEHPVQNVTQYRMRPSTEHAVLWCQDRVSPATENVYNDAFWEGLDVVVNALDNVKVSHLRSAFFRKKLHSTG